MLSFVLKWVLHGAALLLVAYFVPGIAVASFYNALVFAAVLGIINLILKPVLVLLTLPINLITLGLFTLVINGLLFWFAASIVKGFQVSGFVPAFLGALVFSLIAMLINHLV